MNGTYTQRRRRQMAGGGITNVRPRQGYFLGGIGDFFGGIKDKFVDDIIPNELKEIVSSPAGAAALATAVNYAPVMLPGGSDQTLIQQGMEKLGMEPGPNVWDIITGGGNVDPDNPMKNIEQNIGNPIVNTLIQSLMGNQGMTQGYDYGIGNLMNQFNIGKTLEDLTGWGGGTFLDKELPFLDPYRKVETRAATKDRYVTDPEDATKKILIPGTPAQYETRVNPLYPLAGGEIARRYVESQPRDELPMDKTGIDFANLERDLRFEPQEQYRLTSAQGGRIGYNRGRVVNPGGYAGEMNLKDEMIKSDPELLLRLKKLQEQKRLEESLPVLRKNLPSFDTLRDIYLKSIEGNAQGGRIGLKEGTK